MGSWRKCLLHSLMSCAHLLLQGTTQVSGALCAQLAVPAFTLWRHFRLSYHLRASRYSSTGNKRATRLLLRLLLRLQPGSAGATGTGFQLRAQHVELLYREVKRKGREMAFL